MSNQPSAPIASVTKLLLAATLSFFQALQAGGMPASSSIGTDTASSTKSPIPKMSPALEDLINYRCDRAIARTVPPLIQAAGASLSDRSNRNSLAQYYLLIGRAFMFDENGIAAAQSLEIAHKLDPNNLCATAYLADDLAKLGRMEESDSMYRLLEPLAGKDVTATKAVATRAIRKFDYPSAARYLQTAIRLDRSDNSSRVQLAGCLRSQGFNDRAVAMYKIAAEKDLSSYNKELLLGLADALSDNPDGAMQHYKLAGRILPDEPSWHTKLAFILIDHGGKDVALKEFEQARRCPRFCSSSLTIFAEYLSFMDRKQEALKYLDRLEQIMPLSSIVHVARGDIYRRMKDYSRAEAEFKKAIENNPKCGWAYDDLASLYAAQKRWDLLTRTAEDAVRQLPEFSRAWKRLGDGQAAESHFDQAIKSYQKALALFAGPLPGLDAASKAAIGSVHAAIGRCYYKTNRLEEAIEEARQFNHLKNVPKPIKYLSWVHLRPDRLNFKQPPPDTAIGKAVRHAALADMFYETADLTDCCREYRKAIELEPNNIEWNTCLFTALMDNNDYGEALKQDFVLANKLLGKAPRAVTDLKKAGDMPKARTAPEQPGPEQQH